MVTATWQWDEETEDILALEEQYEAIVEAAGAWTDENHPELQSEEDIDRWLAKLRSGWFIQFD